MRHMLTSVLLSVILFPVSLWAQESPGEVVTAPTGAPMASPETAPPVAPAPAPEASPPVEKPAAAEAPEETESSGDGIRKTNGISHEGGIQLPYGLRLNGKFDLSYERYGYTDKLDEGKNALRNYHHFVFLSRHSKSDPFFLTAELVDLTFYEFGARLKRDSLPFTTTLRAGKILVPFGNEPLFHHEYGGLSGFDQPILPIIWSQHGAAANMRMSFGGLSIANDLYAVQGFALKTSDAVLNLQNDFSPAEDVRLGWGDRLSVGWGPLTAWYSAYFNSLDFSRLLFLQALDVGVWRPTTIPVIRDLALTAGILRGDVSGGEEGEDYYIFGDYVQLRYYPVDWLYLQARSGLATFDNRTGFYIDDHRLTNRDGSSHNLSVVYKQAGFMTELSHYWNTEKVNEKDNDFLRLRVGYDF